MSQLKFNVGDVAFIKHYHDVNDHCGLSETDWERMYNRELCIAQTQKKSYKYILSCSILLQAY